MTPKPNYDEALNFLERWGGEYAHCFALQPDLPQGAPGAIISHSFRKPLGAMLKDWMRRAQDGRKDIKLGVVHHYNLYFQVNDFDGELGRRRKIAEHEITTVNALHTDLDHVDIDEMFARLEADEQPPDKIIFSGGGLNCFWIFDPPVAVSTEAERMHIKSLNIGLRDKWGGDGVANLDRILRVPGTLNFPNAKKRSEGRDIAVARVLK